MRSLILRKAAEGILPLTALFGLYLLLRGHDEPGGGFIAGLVTSAALVLQALAFGSEWARTTLLPVLRPAFALGLITAIAAAVLPVLAGDPLLTHYHLEVPLPDGGSYHLTTALLFDVGVYLVVVGTTAALFFIFAEVAE